MLANVYFLSLCFDFFITRPTGLSCAVFDLWRALNSADEISFKFNLKILNKNFDSRRKYETKQSYNIDN